MEWLEKQVAAAFCGSLKQPKRLKYSWNSNDIDFFLKKANNGSILLVFVAGVTKVDPGDEIAVELGPATIVKSSLGGLPAESSNNDAIGSRHDTLKYYNLIENFARSQIY